MRAVGIGLGLWCSFCFIVYTYLYLTDPIFSEVAVLLPLFLGGAVLGFMAK